MATKAILLQLGLMLMLVLTTSGWVSLPTTSRSLSTKPSCLTTRYMFDWLKPKTPTPAPAPVPAPPAPAAAPPPAPAPASAAPPVEEEKKQQEAQKEEEPVDKDEPANVPKEAPAKEPVTASASASADSSALDITGTHKGTVKWFNSVKGYGFIVPQADNIPDVFVHQTAVYKDGFRSLGDGEDVEFKIEVDNQGRYKALDVTGPGGVQVQGSRY